MNLNLQKKNQALVQLFLCCLACLCPTATVANVQGGQVKVVDCWQLMRTADANNDNRLDQNEYWNFTKAYDDPANGGDDTYAGLSGPGQAPTYWIRTWNALLTVCPNEPSVQSQACEIQNAGTLYRQQNAPKPEITGNSDLYVFTICYATQAALLKSENSAAPSAFPTEQPSESPSTAPPTPSPTNGPTTSPSKAPTKGPTTSPSKAPTTTPSVTPTASPTRSPNLQPSSSPTAAPSKAPTRTPTKTPTASPTTSRPTRSPTLSPSKTPSRTPTKTPTASPTTQAPSTSPTTPAPTASVGISQTAQFDLAFRHANVPVSSVSQNSAIWQQLYSDTVVASNILVTEAVQALEGQRRLALSIASQCELTNPQAFSCPTDGTVATDAVCETVTMTCYVLLTGEDTLEADSISSAFLTKWLDLALQGKFQTHLDFATEDNDNDIQYIDSRSTSALTSNPVTAHLSSAVTGGIVTAAIIAVILPFVLLLFYRNRARDREEKQKVYYEPYDPAEDAPSELEPDTMDAELYHTRSPKAQPRGLAMLGASRPSYGMTKATQKYLEDVERGEDILAEPEFDVERDSSSNAGSSGWSSSAGYSSYNTGSIDDDMDAALAAGTTLAAIGVGVTSSLSKMRGTVPDRPSSPSGTSSSPSISRDQLDSFIEAGDWAAVGATAALLAAASDSQSASTNDRSRRSRSSSYESDSLEAARAAELDHLVDAGDWEGVVLAAARFEAAEMTVSSRSRDSRTASSVASTGSNSHTDDGGATGSSPSQSESATGSDDPSRARQRREVRAEVEALVRRVVPEEIDNVDEMMNQFKGREEELVETLRTMQERAIAQKARSAGHKSAKLEARKNVKRGVVPGARPPPPVAAQPPPTSAPPPSSQPAAAPIAATTAAATGVAAVAAVSSRSNSKSSSSGTVSDSQESSTLGSLQDARTALDKAIDAGDWEAVGQTAAFMSDASIATNETGDVDRMGHSNISTTTSGSTRTRQTKDSETAIRAAELDEMINRGDWSAVVAAANRFSQMDKKVKSELGRTAEEEEALAQAEFWTNIANQKKAQGANDVGASDAAEWAIQRSLSQMNKQDSSTPNKNEGNDEDEV